MKNLLTTLTNLNISLVTEGDGLNICDPDEQLTEDLLSAINEKKKEILNHLNNGEDKAGINANYQQEEGAENKTEEAFWIYEFNNRPSPLILPADFVRPSVKKKEGHRLRFTIDQKATEALSTLGRQEETTMFVILMSVYAVLLSKLSGQQDIVIGNPGTNGFVLPLRNKIKGTDHFTDFLKSTQSKTLSCFKNQPFLARRSSNVLGLSNDQSLINVLFSYDELELAHQQSDFTEEEVYDLGPIVFSYDLAIAVRHQKEALFVDFDYSTQLFTQSTIRRFAEYFKKIVSLITTEPDIRISDIDTVHIKEKFLLLNKFNRTKTDLPEEKTIIDLFKNQVEKTPENYAVWYGEQALNYQDLDLLSNQLANYLSKNYSIEVEDLIGIQIDPNEWLIISLLAVLKTGAAYVPIDPDLPTAKIDYIKQSSRCKVIIDAELLATFWASQNDYETIAPELNLNVQNLACVVFTSDDAKMPQGVMIEHQNLLNLCIWHQLKYQVTAQSKGALFFGIGSETFLWEVFPYLINGAALYLPREKEVASGVPTIHHFLEDKAITHCFLPVQICQELEDRNFLLDKTYILTRGNKPYLPQSSNLKISYNYGPLEATIVTTTYDLNATLEGLLPIGKPISNTCIYILSDQLRLQPLGVAGELYIAGSGVSRGYLNNEQLTSEKFIINPFKGKGLLYKTGDLARWLPDGNIEFLGKISKIPLSVTDSDFQSVPDQTADTTGEKLEENYRVRG